MGTKNADTDTQTLERARAAESSQNLQDQEIERANPEVITIGEGDEAIDINLTDEVEVNADKLQKVFDRILDDIAAASALEERLAELVETDPDLAWPPQHGRTFRFNEDELLAAGKALDPQVNPCESIGVKPTAAIAYAQMIRDICIEEDLQATDYGAWMLAIGFALAGGTLIPYEEQKAAYEQGVENAKAAHPELFEETASTVDEPEEGTAETS